MGYDTITFLSDYGRSDEFVGVVHSVVRSIAPDAHVIDLSHDIAAFDIRGGGLLLARSAPFLTPGVVLAVVDPGVGTDRRPVAIEVGNGSSVLVGPDNGLLAPAVALVGGADRAVELTAADYHLEGSSTTFDGRDIFGPVAAYLANGVDFAELGEAIDPATLVPGTMPVARHDGDELVAEVLWVDRFGNAQLNVDIDDLVAYGERVSLRVGENRRSAQLVSSFDALSRGDLGVLADSVGLAAIVAARASAAAELGLAHGSEVVVSEATSSGGVTASVTLGRRPEPAPSLGKI